MQSVAFTEDPEYLKEEYKRLKFFLSMIVLDPDFKDKDQMTPTAWAITNVETKLRELGVDVEAYWETLRVEHATYKQGLLDKLTQWTQDGLAEERETRLRKAS